MRKRIVTPVPQDSAVPDQDWLNVEELAEVEVTSEDPAHPIESALLPGGRSGWRAAGPGKQTIRLLFASPQCIGRIWLSFADTGTERTQEYVLRWSADGGQSFTEIVRQQWNFSPQGATCEIEDHHVELAAVTALELTIIPDIGGGNAVATLAHLRLACPTNKTLATTTNEWNKREHAEAYLARMKDIPHRDEGESTLLSEVPAQAKRVLDLGCGNGHLLSLVLDHCRNATGVGLDFSPTMLEQARDRFVHNERVTLVEHNMDNPLPNLGRFDCIVSSFAIHHCTDQRKQDLYTEAFALLEPGGVFCNLDHVSSPTERIHARFVEAMGMTPADEDPSNKLLDVETQLRWLREIGFEEVDCHWKWRELALLSGRKPDSPGVGA